MSNYNIKTVPNQKVVKVTKQPCNKEKKENYYATINLMAMEQAAQNLDAGAFKLWCYFAKNQDNYEFALSSKAAADNFGLKKKQYDNAIKELTEKGYLVVSKGNYYIFSEIPVVSKGNNAVVPKSNNAVVSKGDNQLYPKDTRNITDTTFNTTINTTVAETSANAEAPASNEPEVEVEEKPEAKAEGTVENPYIVSKDWLIARHNYISKLANGLFRYRNEFYKMED